MKIKKLIATALLSLTVVSVGVVPALADSGSNINISFNSYGGKGYLDGSAQAKYYHLTTGNVHANITSYNGAGGMKVTLRKRNNNGGYSSYGTQTVTQADKYQWKVSGDSYHYYLYCKGVNNYTQYTATGEMHDHGK